VQRFQSHARAHRCARNRLFQGSDMADDNDKDDASEQRRQKLVKAGVAVGIGSAAIVAALLYASKVKKRPRG
jgi:hypothetical protein